MSLRLAVGRTLRRDDCTPETAAAGSTELTENMLKVLDADWGRPD
jgi:hypothetical protein